MPRRPKEEQELPPVDEPTTWPDGTPRSTNNAFCGHGFVGRNKPAQPSHARKAHTPSPRSARAFGTVGGQIHGMSQRRI